MNNLGKRLSESLNIMYKDVVNKKQIAPINTIEYVEAKDFVDTYYPELNANVMEYLAMYMCVHPDGTAEFFPSNNNAVDLLCQYADQLRVVGYNEVGAIVKDDTSIRTPIQRGE